jgi:ubiquinone/menaquinone biosynthesis C-methylase UbiE
VSTGTVPRYAFDNDNPEAIDQHACLAAIQDPVTTSRLASLDLRGKRCLEIGAGAGSVARWLADRVGPGGEVVATDIKPVRIPEHPQLRVMLHDVATDPLPGGGWDVIHARLVLVHLPARREVLHRLAEALAPGGALLIEEWDTRPRDVVLSAPVESARLYRRYLDTLVDRILVRHGSDNTWATRMHAAMLEEGLDVDTVVASRSWSGGTPGTLLIASNINHLRETFLANGWTADEIDALCTAVRDPGFVVRGHLLYSTMGRRS